MRIDVLGPLVASSPSTGLPVHLTERERRVLALLTLRRPLPVPFEELLDGVWGDDAPPTARKALQVHVAALRRKLGPRTIATCPSGYALERDVHVDADAFEDYARLVFSAPDIAGRANLIDDALALWRGEAWADLLDHVDAAPARAKAIELRLSLEEADAACRIREHRLEAASAGLASLVVAEPYRERRWALLAIAQYRCGRRRDALATLQRAATTLRHDLGLDPGPDLVALERMLLDDAPTLYDDIVLS